MPSYSGKRSAAIFLILGPETLLNVFPREGACFGAPGAATLPVFSSLPHHIYRHLVFLATKDYLDRLLGISKSIDEGVES
jgi:hypothetical protein